MRAGDKAVRGMWDYVVARPIRDGVIWPQYWPLSLRAAGLWCLVFAVISAASAAAADVIRSRSPLVVVTSGELFPPLGVPVLAVGLFLATTMIQTAALQLWWPVRILVVSIGLICPTMSLMLMGDSTVLWLAVGGAAGLALLHCVTRRFAWWHLGAVGVCVLIMTQPTLWTLAQMQRVGGIDLRPRMLDLQLMMAIYLVLPSLIMAGTALMSVALTIGQGAGDVLVKQQPRLYHWVLLAFVLLVPTLTCLETFLGLLPSQIVSAAGETVLTLTGAALITLPFYRRARRSAPLVENQSDLVEIFESRWPFLVACSMLVSFSESMADLIAEVYSRFEVSPPAFLTNIETLADQPETIGVVRILAGLAALIVAWFATAQGRWLVVPLLACFCSRELVVLVSQASPWGRLMPQDAVRDAILLLLILAAITVRALTHAMTDRAFRGIFVAAAVLAASQYREILAEPFEWFFGQAAVGVVVFGLIWRAITEGRSTREDSRRYPHPARICMYLGTLLLAATVVCYTSLSKATGGYLDPNMWADLGDLVFAGPLLICGVLLPLVFGAGSAQITPRPAPFQREPLAPVAAPGFSAAPWGPPLGGPVPLPPPKAFRRIE